MGIGRNVGLPDVRHVVVVCNGEVDNLRIAIADVLRDLWCPSTKDKDGGL